MIRQPPRSPLFPLHDALPILFGNCCAGAGRCAPRAAIPSATAQRSEEHTSELQSLTNLVCRLLLEKKNNQSHNTTITDQYKDKTNSCRIDECTSILGDSQHSQ